MLCNRFDRYLVTISTFYITRMRTRIWIYNLGKNHSFIDTNREGMAIYWIINVICSSFKMRNIWVSFLFCILKAVEMVSTILIVNTERNVVSEENSSQKCVSSHALTYQTSKFINTTVLPPESDNRQKKKLESSCTTHETFSSKLLFEV